MHKIMPLSCACGREHNIPSAKDLSYRAARQAWVGNWAITRASNGNWPPVWATVGSVRSGVCSLAFPLQVHWALNQGQDIPRF